MSLRWLHLSDVHETRKDGANRARMYDQILAEVQRQPKPDIVFVTGDVAYAGRDTEYQSLEESFIRPLKALVGDCCPLLIVPGNHDLDRDRSVPPRSWVNETTLRSFQAVSTEGAMRRKDTVGPRFEAYAAFDARNADWQTPGWLTSEDGAALWSGEIGGHRLAVVGLNTAWLCQDDDDWGRISPGRYMTERMLERAAKYEPDLLVVLGHHPLEAMSVEHQPFDDGGRVRRRLEKHRAVYLHGHLHRTGAGRTGSGVRASMSIQAPSAFQAHDSERWRNGLLWGEVDFEVRKLALSPMRWNEDLEEYVFDTDAFHRDQMTSGCDAFQVGLPGDVDARKDDSSSDGMGSVEPPEGWEVVDRQALSEFRDREPTQDEMIGFFDGLLPTWRLVLARGVERREVSQALTATFRTAFEGAAKPLVGLLQGAGGEGKSTASLQAGAALVEDTDQSWTLLRRHSVAAALPPDLLKNLPRIPHHSWLVMVDDADGVAHEVLAALRNVAPRTDIHVLLTARTADWISVAPVPGDWQGVADYRPRSIAGLTESDAGRIVRAWAAWGGRAMGVLEGQTEQEAVRSLLDQARKLATRKEGELLGALLVTRLGEDMRAHVRTMLAGLSRDPVMNGFSLLDGYAIIASMHAENQLYLSPSVMTSLFQGERSELDRSVLNPLRQEAMLEMGQAALLTRHRVIAEAACQVLREDGYDLDRWYGLLTRAACRMALQRLETPALAQWRFDLPRHFVKKGEPYWPLARRIGLEIFDADPSNVQTVTAYSSVLRDTRRPADAMAILSNLAETFCISSSFLKEWSTVAGIVGDDGLSCWLAGRSMADESDQLDDLRVRLGLSGLAISFQRLFEKLGDPAFSAAQGACGQLGIAMSGSGPGQGHFARHVTEGRNAGVGNMKIDAAMAAVRIGILKGSYEVDPNHDPIRIEALVGDPAGYKFSRAVALVTEAAARFASRARAS